MFLVSFTFVAICVLVVWALSLQAIEYFQGMMACYKDKDILGTIAGCLGVLLFTGSALIFTVLAVHFFQLAI